VSASVASERGLPPVAERAAAGAREGWLSWNRALAALVLVVWLVPIKLYTLPVHLPFNLELYRLLLLALVLVWLGAAVAGARPIAAGGLGRPALALAAVATLSVLANLHAIDGAGLQTQALKSLSYFVGFLLAYALVCSTVDGSRGVRVVTRAIVAGGGVVALAALYESRTRYNVFTHLHSWLPLLHPTHAAAAGHVRSGQLRVVASAQHPIALGAALVLAVPLALWLAAHARTRLRALLGWAAAGLLLAGAVATVSRTVILMAVAMLAAGLVVRGREVARRWPLLLVLVLALHVAAPGSVTHLYRAFFPKQGLSTSLDARSGAVGSGRLADLGPAARSWQQAPFLGHGLGTGGDAGTVGAIVDPNSGVPIVFDDQYLNSFVSIGALGLAAVVWFVWGAGGALVRRGRRRAGPDDDLIAAFGVSAVGFAAGMLTFDAFSFVQCTLLFFVIAALGLKLRELDP
jgi:hypothetical protein